MEVRSFAPVAVKLEERRHSLRLLAKRSPVRIRFYQFRDQEAGESFCALLVQMATAIYRCISTVGRNNDFDSKRFCQFVRLSGAILAVWHQRQYDLPPDVLQVLACNPNGLRSDVTVAAAIKRDFLVIIGRIPRVDLDGGIAGCDTPVDAVSRAISRSVVGNVILGAPAQIANGRTDVTGHSPMARGRDPGCGRPESQIEGPAEKMDELVVGIDHPQRCSNFPACNNSARKFAAPNSDEGHVIDVTTTSRLELAQHRFVQSVRNKRGTEYDYICRLGGGHRAAHIVIKQFLVLDFRHSA